jgi:hypothetical protein
MWLLLVDSDVNDDVVVFALEAIPLALVRVRELMDELRQHEEGNLDAFDGENFAHGVIGKVDRPVHRVAYFRRGGRRRAFAVPLELLYRLG